MTPYFGLKNSSQHQTNTSLLRFVRKNWATPPFPRSRLRFSTSTPKPRAEGSSPSAPAKNREASTMLASLFFVSAHKDSATRCGCALRSACRGVSERQWRSAANRPRRQPRPSPARYFLLAYRVFPSGFTHSQPFPSPPAPKTHPVSPFLGFSGCV